MWLPGWGSITHCGAINLFCICRDEQRTISLPLNDPLMLPKLPRRPPNIPTRQQHHRPRPLIHRLRPPIPRHIRTHIPRAAAIHQHFPTPSLLLPRDRPRRARDAALAHGVRGPRPAELPLPPLRDGRGEGVDEGGDVVDGLGRGEGGADRGRVFRVQVAGHAGDVDEAAAGAEEGEEGPRRGQGAVVVDSEGLLDDVHVWFACAGRFG